MTMNDQNKNKKLGKSLYKGLSPYLRLIRLPLAVLGFLAPISLLSWIDMLFTSRGLFTILAIGFINIAFNCWNEIVDVKDDQENPIKSHRPLPRGDISLRNATRFSFYMLGVGIVGLVGLAFIEPPIAVLGSIGILGGIYYNFVSRTWGNIGLGLVYGMTAYICTYPEHILFALAFSLYVVFFNVGVQIQDMVADAKVSLAKVMERKINLNILVSCAMLVGSATLFVLENVWFFSLPVALSLAGLIWYWIEKRKMSSRSRTVTCPECF